MKNQMLAIKQLDSQLKEWQLVNQKYGKPRTGWIKTLRVALSMSAEQFAARLGLTRGRVNQLEIAEVHDSVTLRTLKEAANALECELIYAIVPKGNSTLENIIKKRAEHIAKERIANISHSMSLEAQSVDTETLQFQKEELAKNLVAHLNKKFWAMPDELDQLAETIYVQLQKDQEIPIQKGWKEIFLKKLSNHLIKMQKKNEINESDLLIKIKNPKYINALKNALIRYHLNKKSKKNDSIEKLIENLQKKK